MNYTELDRRLVQVVPSPRQFAYQQLEFYAFVHFTVNTFTGREWGDGTEDPAIFNPEKLDARQWARAVKSAGMRGLILTCKHHDGFCLWPSRYTEHSVAHSPYQGGKGDIVRETAQACREEGLRFGAYLSPWDRNNPLYGQGKAYDDYFCAQLEELLTGYGDIFAVWFDGACGEGPNGKKQYYDWERYYALIRKLQPGACINVCGPDIRWCGNEAGDTRPSEWSVVPARTRDTEKIASLSQQADDESFRQRKISASDKDLGSREALREEQELIWYPAEVNTSIRPGWFYHPEEDNQVKSLDTLLDVYVRSVGGNGTFLLNIPPRQRGCSTKTTCGAWRSWATPCGRPSGRTYWKRRPFPPPAPRRATAWKISARTATTAGSRQRRASPTACWRQLGKSPRCSAEGEHPPQPAGGALHPGSAAGRPVERGLPRHGGGLQEAHPPGGTKGRQPAGDHPGCPGVPHAGFLGRVLTRT